MASKRQAANYFWMQFLYLRAIAMDFNNIIPSKTFTNFVHHYLYFVYVFLMHSLLIVAFTILEVMQTPYILHNRDRLMSNIGFTINQLNNAVKILFIFFNRKSLLRIADILEGGMRKYRQNDELLRRTIRISQMILIMFTLVVIVVGVCGTAQSVAEVFVFVEGVNATKNVTLHLPYEAYPLITPSPGWRYYLMKYHQVTSIFYGGVVITATDSILCAFLLHIRCQFITLQETLQIIDILAMRRLLNRSNENLPNDDNKSLTSVYNIEDAAEESKELRTELSQLFTDDEIEHEITVYFKECIKHHSDIIDCVKLFISAYSVPILCQLGASSLTVCSATFQLTTAEIGSVKFMMSLFFFSHMMLQLALICLAGNEVTEQGLLIHGAVYKSQWVGSKGLGALKHAADLRFMMMRAAKPVHVTAAQFTTLSASTFLVVVKGAYSYYSLIKS